MDEKTWVDKYSPKKIENLTCNRDAVNTIKLWLNNFDKNKNIYLERISELQKNKKGKKLKKEKLSDTNKTLKNKPSNINECSSIVVTGKHGIGKTVSVRVILKNLNYEVRTIDFNQLKNTKDKDTFMRAFMKDNILNIMNTDSKIKTKTALLIDEIEGITSLSDKQFIMSLLEKNDKEWYQPIIMISNDKHGKLLTEVKKMVFTIRFFTPYMKDFKSILRRVACDNKMKFQSHTVIDKILEYTQLDIRKLLYMLRDLYYTSNDKIINDNMLESYIKYSKQKDVDYDLFSATNGLLYNYKNIDNCLKLFETDKVTLPIMIHQYYLDVVINNFDDEDKQYELANKISNSLANGDIVENLIYGGQSWNMQEVHGYYSCVIPSFDMSYKRTTETPITKSLTYAHDFSKMSIKNINKKNILNANKCFTNMKTMDFIYANKILRSMINNNNIKNCVDIIKDYNIKLEHIEWLLKTDKITDKITLTTKQKKEFNKFLQ